MQVKPQNHMFNIEVAQKYGVYEAIVLNNLFYWIQQNAANERHCHDGHYWTYNSTKAFTQLFPYFSEKQIRTILGKLEKSGLILVGNYNKSAYDRTKWYALTDKALALFGLGSSIFPNGQMEETERENGSDRKGEPIPNINTDSKPIDKPDRESAPANVKKEPKKREPKHKHGEFGHVLLTDRELDKLKADFKDYKTMIRNLDEYLEMHPRKSYANHNLTMRRWKRDDEKKAATGKTQIVTRDPEESGKKWGGLINV